MRIIPAIDIIEGKCVRLTQGIYTEKTTYSDQPLELAKQFEDNGLQYLHLVDLDGARNGKVVNWKVLEKIATHTHLKIDFGGGICTNQDLQIAFQSGANQVVVGSMAVKNPSVCYEWIAQYGSEKIILGADVREERVAIAGWQNQTEILLTDFLKKYVEKRIQYVICTDISRDGLLQGTAKELYQKILQEFPMLKLIASGGVNTIQEIEKLAQLGVEGVIIGKAIYEKKIQLKDLASFLM
ncbi:MAG: 1-(5-phosphoribosyl)-5-[(5-phosphoribosylamino)methylideneamino]imidazole-4-carboxamide isomerase [Microscillaceae bacterium]|nr:1-(5-phosphoribosyl)-5-[(5-phosphoribosylamino)methylideneamino]imidazole-4-carboxamide isomerase [Microscillaceae bacterium]MDW8461085.1 1-(5-phosphoribosyl)-5-[(5-phosphoribosylamino)methylideneamino]imidazole-4-carboxamide isomerase [Cytophagales bacterium]